MTREDRIREMLAKLVEQDELVGGAYPISPLGKTRAMYIREKQGVTVTAWQAVRIALDFADAEAAAMRERAAEIAEGHIGAWRDEWGSGFDAACEEIATAIRNLPAAGEVGRG